jgi:hypothetical protein
MFIFMLHEHEKGMIMVMVKNTGKDKVTDSEMGMGIRRVGCRIRGSKG